MAAQEKMVPSVDNFQLEIESLKENLLSRFLFMFIFVGWFWFPFIMFNNWKIGINTLPTALSLCSSFIIYKIHESNYRVSCFLLLFTSIIFNSIIIFSHPDSNAMSFGVILVIAAHALLGTREALLTVSLGWLVGSLA